MERTDALPPTVAAEFSGGILTFRDQSADVPTVKDRRAQRDPAARRPWRHQHHGAPPASATRSGRRHRSRGAAILEAAFITPVFFTLVLGIVEFGLVMNDYLAVASTVRAGARTASALGNDVYADHAILASINRESTALDRSYMTRIVIYRPSSFGEKPSEICQHGTPGAADFCNTYTPADFTKDKVLYFGCDQSAAVDKNWCPKNRKVSLAGAGPAYVGVWIEYRHHWVTKMFGSVKTLSDSSVVRLEPRTNAP